MAESLSGSVYHNKFYDFLGEVTQTGDESLIMTANKLPKDGITEVKMDSHGNFEIHYSKAHKGKARHDDKAMHEKIGGTVIKTSKVIKGTLDRAGPSLRFTPGSVVAEAKMSLLKFDVSLVEVKPQEGGKTVQVTGKWGLEKSETLSKDTVLSTQVDWDE